MTYVRVDVSDDGVSVAFDAEDPAVDTPEKVVAILARGLQAIETEPVPEDEFQSELRSLINRHSKENGSDTQDFILAEYLNRCLQNWDYCTRYRDQLK